MYMHAASHLGTFQASFPIAPNLQSFGKKYISLFQQCLVRMITSYTKNQDMQCNQARHKPMIKPRMTKCITSLITDQCKEMPRTQIIAMKMKCEINHIGNQRGE